MKPYSPNLTEFIARTFYAHWAVFLLALSEASAAAKRS
jgi:hypothetical protein